MMMLRVNYKQNSTYTYIIGPIQNSMIERGHVIFLEETYCAESKPNQKQMLLAFWTR